MSRGTNADRDVSRRKILALTLSGAAAGVAGCSGDGGGGDGTTPTGTGTGTNTGTSTTSGDTTGTGTSETTEETTQGQLSPDEMADPTPDTAIDFIPQDANWNIFSSGPLDGNLVFQPLARHYWNNTSEWFILEEEGFSYNSDTLTATYNLTDGYSWWNGDEITAKDYWQQLEIGRLQNPEASVIEEYTMADDYTVKAKRKKKLNPILINQGAGRIMEHPGKYEQWYNRLSDATSQEERKAIQKEMTNWKISTEEFANEGLGNVVYQLSDWSTQKFTFERYDDHPQADQAPFPKIAHHVAKGSSLNQAITNDKLDYMFGRFPENLQGSAPEYLETIFKNRTVSCRNLLFNYKDNKHIGRRNVRRALMTVLDWTNLKNFWQGSGGFVKQTQTGIPQVLQNRWLGDEIMSQMYKYPLESDPEQANAFMEKAGYTREGGTWVDEDGDPLQFSLLIGEFGTLEALGKAMNQSWKQWGAQSELLAQSNSSWIEKTTNAEGWSMSVFKHGFNSTSPLNFYAYDSHWHMRLGSRTEINQWLEEGKTHSQINGRPIKLTIPSEPGALEVEGDGVEINIPDLVDELEVTQSEERTREIIRLLARYWNYDLPEFDMFPQTASMWGDTKNFQWPDEANQYYTGSNTADDQVWQSGIVKPVPKDQV